MEPEQAWRRAVEKTWIARFPKQHLATFGTTNLAYYVVTEPVYVDLDLDRKEEGVVRTGRVIAERPAVVTPTYAMNLHGFSPEAYEYLRDTARSYGPNSPGILYQYKNEAHKVDILSGPPSEIAYRISDDLDRRKEDLSVVLVGVDELWDVALLKFIYEFSSSSAGANVPGAPVPRPARPVAEPWGGAEGGYSAGRGDVPEGPPRRRPRDPQARARPVGPVRVLRRALPEPLPKVARIHRLIWTSGVTSAASTHHPRPLAPLGVT